MPESAPALDPAGILNPGVLFAADVTARRRLGQLDPHRHEAKA